MAKYDTLTPDLINSGESEIAEAVTSVKAGFRSHDKRQGSLMIAAAYTTVAAVRTKSHSKADLSRLWARNASTITLYNRLGTVAVDLGILPNGVEFGDSGISLWSILGGKGGATNSRVGMYIEGGKSKDFPYYEGQAPTVDGLVDLLSDYFKPNGEKWGPDERKAHEAKREWMLRNPETDVSEYVGESPKDETDNDGDGEVTLTGTRTLDQQFNTAADLLIGVVGQMDESVWAGTAEKRNALAAALRKAKAALEPKVAKAS